MPYPILPRPVPVGPPGSATAVLPFRGLTLLLVEDSRVACDVLRLIWQRLGGRLVRAETLVAARSRLGGCHPDLAIVDIGLPDGRGDALIAELAAAGLPVLATSGDPDNRALALAAGASGFLEKPLGGIGDFQRLVLRLVRGGARHGPILPLATALPDPLALRDDLTRALQLAGRDGDYVARFVQGLARSAGDPELEAAVRDAGSDRDKLTQLLRDRLQRGAVLG